MTILPISSPIIREAPQASIETWIEECLKKAEVALQDGDILVVTSKLVSFFEKRLVELQTIIPLERAEAMAQTMNADPRLIELVLQEADEIIAETKWVLLTRKNGILSANAGIDTSNVMSGYAILWPLNSFDSALRLQQSFFERQKLGKFAVLITDSLCIPGRNGSLAIALGYSGIRGLHDLRNTPDLFGKTLRYSAHNIVDSLATAANVVMGEGTEAIPLSVIRDYDWQAADSTKREEMIIPSSDEMFPLASSL